MVAVALVRWYRRSMARIVRVVGLVLAVACGPGAPNGTTAGEPGDPTGGPGVASTTGEPVVTGSAGTSSGESTSSTSSGAGTHDATLADATTALTGDVTTSGVAGSSTTEVEPPCEDSMDVTATTGAWPGNVPKCVDTEFDWKTEHVDCLVECSTMTQIHGEGPAAGIKPVTRIAFGVDYGVCGTGIALNRFYLGRPAAPQATIYAGLECALDPFLGSHEVGGWLPDSTDIDVTMTIESYAGDWHSEDPVDPPRLLGHLAGDLVGPFEAIHCAALDVFYKSCGSAAPGL